MSSSFGADLQKTILEFIRIMFKTILEYSFFDYSVDECHFFLSALLSFVLIDMIYKIIASKT